MPDREIGRAEPGDVAGDVHWRRPSERRGRSFGEIPEDDDEGYKTDGRREQLHEQIERGEDEAADVLADALVGVVAVAGVELAEIVGAVAEPLVEEASGEPAPPEDFKRREEVILGKPEGD